MGMGNVKWLNLYVFTQNKQFPSTHSGVMRERPRVRATLESYASLVIRASRVFFSSYIAYVANSAVVGEFVGCHRFSWRIGIQWSVSLHASGIVQRPKGPVPEM